MKFYNNFQQLFQKFKLCSGVNSGVIRNFFVYSGGKNNELGLNMVTGSMPDYTRLTINPEHNMSYHISGYGNKFEEAFIRFIGESVERYSSVNSHIYLSNYIEFMSFSELAKEHKEALIMPPNIANYLNLDMLKKMNKLNEQYRSEFINDSSKIGWVKAFSLFNPNQPVYIPAFLFFVGYVKDQLSTPSFTTGCACHETIEKAFINSIIEYNQIDAFMLHWYTSLPKRCIKFDSLPINVKSAINKSMGYYKNKYDVLFVDYSDQAKIKIPILGIFIIAKDEYQYPAISFGVQSAFDLEETFYRGTQEALAVLEMSTYFPINRRDILKLAKDKNNEFFDLDSNVCYFALTENRDNNLNFIKKYIKEEINYNDYKKYFEANIFKNDACKLKFLIGSIKEFSRYACFLNITPSNILDHTLNVTRVFIPELLHMSFPKFPYFNHNRYKSLKDIKYEYYPHPLP